MRQQRGHFYLVKQALVKPTDCLLAPEISRLFSAISAVWPVDIGSIILEKHTLAAFVRCGFRCWRWTNIECQPVTNSRTEDVWFSAEEMESTCYCSRVYTQAYAVYLSIQFHYIYIKQELRSIRLFNGSWASSGKMCIWLWCTYRYSGSFLIGI